MLLCHFKFSFKKDKLNFLFISSLKVRCSQFCQSTVTKRLRNLLLSSVSLLHNLTWRNNDQLFPYELFLYTTRITWFQIHVHTGPHTHMHIDRFHGGHDFFQVTLVQYFLCFAKSRQKYTESQNVGAIERFGGWTTGKLKC